MRILLMEDQKHMAYAIEHVLNKNKYTVDVVFDGEEGLNYALTNVYDVLILDVMVPKLNGFELIKKLRDKKIQTPIIFLTAKSEVEDKINGLDLGGDDYITKPFEMEELMARIRCVARRKGNINEMFEFKYKDIKYDKESLILSSNDKSYTLTVKEAKLIEKIITKEFIISKLWNFDKVVIDNNIEVYISFLRKKIEILNSKVKIKTIRGIGYMLVGEEDV